MTIRIIFCPKILQIAKSIVGSVRCKIENRIICINIVF